MNETELRTLVSSSFDLQSAGFEALRAIATLVNSGKDKLAREMVLRVLENRKSIGAYSAVLDGLVRELGLFPYLDEDLLGLRDLIAHQFHKPLNLENEVVFHRQQGDVYRRLMNGENLILSAPTSFGKSRVIDAMIAADRFDNVVVVVPTIALIDETRRRLATFSNRYKIVTQISQEPAARNVFVFTAERANAYLHFPKIDFVAIDEFYKIGALSEDRTRTIALNQAFYQFVKGGAQFYMLGPSVHKVLPGVEEKLKCTFYPTTFETVVSEQIELTDGNDIPALVELCKTIHEPTLIYCKSPQRVDEVARALFESGVFRTNDLQDASEWIAKEFHREWILPVGLPVGIGIHHGKLPRSIGQFVVRAFNEGHLRFLVCTSTLIEGVNTKAKNVIIFDNEIARQKLDFFTFNNIKGRSGRMFQYFIGRVFLFYPPPQNELPTIDFPFVSQSDDTPNSILMGLDDSDLTPSAKRRLEPFREQTALPVQILKDQSSFEPEDLLGLAVEIRRMSESDASNLAWQRFPTYPQLKFCMDVVWRNFIKRAHGGVRTSSQLTFKLSQLAKNESIRTRVDADLKSGKFASKSVDEAVERVLQFERTWASFEVPRLLTALEAVQVHVLAERKLPRGRYGVYINRVENLFKQQFHIALEEYGLPLQLTAKLNIGRPKSVDEAIDAIARISPTQFANSFERKLFADFVAHI